MKKNCIILSLSLLVQYGSAQIKIIPGGNVGIGQPSPNFAKLEVLQPNGGNLFSASMGVTSPTLNIWQTSDIVFPGARTSIAYRDCSFEIYDITHTVSKFWIDKNSGNIGVGTQSPATKFEINNNGTIGFMFRSTMGGSGNPMLDIYQSNTGVGGNRTCMLFYNGAYEIWDQTAMATRLWINTSGNIGIGTRSPDPYKLYVSGSAFSTGSWIGSDEKYKKNVKNIEKSLEKILMINGKVYEFKTQEFEDKNFEKGSCYGFIAQELKLVLPEVVKASPDGFLSVNYDAMIPVLVEGIKEQYATIKKMEEKISILEAFTNPLSEGVCHCGGCNSNSTKDLGNSSTGNIESINNSDYSELFQNTPNPFNETTEIKYLLKTGLAQYSQIYIFDMKGGLIKSYGGLKDGGGKIVIESRDLDPGMYLYSLVVNGLEVDTKRMILTK